MHAISRPFASLFCSHITWMPRNGMQVRNSSILADKGKCFLSIYYWHQFSLFFIFVQAGIRCGNVTKRALFPASVNIQEVLAATHLYIWIHASTEAGNRVIGSAHLGVHRTVSQWMFFLYIYIYRHRYKSISISHLRSMMFAVLIITKKVCWM